MDKFKNIISEQELLWFEAVKERFEMFQKDEGYEDALYDLPYAIEDTLANILSGFHPLEDKWINDGDWDQEQDDKNNMTHPYNKLLSLGYDVKKIKDFADKKYKEFKTELNVD